MGVTQDHDMLHLQRGDREFQRRRDAVMAAISDEDADLPIGVFAGRWGEPPARICDAIDALRVMRGERTYITVQPAQDKPVCPKCGTAGCLEDKALDW